MAQTDRQRWDARYREGAYGQRLWPSAYLEQCMPRLTPAQSGARALDVACGRGRNSLYLAQQGFAVEAVDVSPAAIAQGARTALQTGLAINWRCQDVQSGAATWQPQGSFDLIIMFRFVASSLLPVLFEHLTPRRAIVGGRAHAVERHRRTERSVKSCFSGNINGVKTGAVALHRATGGCGGICRGR